MICKWGQSKKEAFRCGCSPEGQNQRQCVTWVGSIFIVGLQLLDSWQKGVYKLMNSKVLISIPLKISVCFHQAANISKKVRRYSCCLRCTRL